MIDSITINYFETHIKTAFNLCTGVNVIQGESDEGKSGIVRAIEWNTENRPQGDSYRNDQLDEKNKKDKLKITDVGIIYTETGLVTRARDGFTGGINHYQINNEEPLRALRTDVPDEVRNITKMKSVNIQGQHPTEQYFLLADTPGQVAKELNKVSGLTVMDKATADINSQIRTCNTEIKEAQKKVTKYQEELDDTKWVDDAEKFANKLTGFKTKINDKEIEYHNLNNKVIHVLEINNILETQYNGLDNAIKDIKTLEKEVSDIIFKEQEQEILQDLIETIKFVDQDLKSSVDTEKALKALKELKTLKNDIAIKEKKKEKIDALIFKLTTMEINIQNANKDCKKAEEEYRIIRREEECPTCGRMGN